MKETSQQTRFRYANQFVGVLVLLTVLIFGMAFLFSGRVREWLDPGGRLKVILPSAGLFGLSEGSAVEVLGTKAGKVIRIVISPDQQMHAEVQIQSDMKAFVRRDSEAVIRKQYGVAGDSFLYISRGIGEPLDWKYAVITAVAERAPTESIGKILDDVRTKVFPILDDTQKAIHVFLTVVEELQDPEGNMQQLFANLLLGYRFPLHKFLQFLNIIIAVESNTVSFSSITSCRIMKRPSSTSLIMSMTPVMCQIR